ncbi:hypothetical protein [Mycobacterium phage WXIN]|nr:hypothetical protein [Mycobacterium phage WXIN]
MHHSNAQVSSCYHCRRDLHEAPLTEAVAKFYDSHSFSADYDPDADESPIACPGSYAYGPARPKQRQSALAFTVDDSYLTWKAYEPVGFLQQGDPAWLMESSAKLAVIQKYKSFLDDLLAWPVFNEALAVTVHPWVIGDPQPEECNLPDDLPEIKFGPENWVKKDLYSAASYEMYGASACLPSSGWDGIPTPDLKADYEKLAKEISNKPYSYLEMLK